MTLSISTIIHKLFKKMHLLETLQKRLFIYKKKKPNSKEQVLQVPLSTDPENGLLESSAAKSWIWVQGFNTGGLQVDPHVWPQPKAVMKAHL